MADLSGKIVKKCDVPGYDAETVVSPDGKNCFTSTRTWRLELWTMDIDWKNLETNLPSV